MGWSDRRRAQRYKAFDKYGTYKAGSISNKYYGERKIFDPSEDTKNRQKIIEEIEKRCTEGEKLEDIVEELNNRPEVRTQFDYYTKNGITDFAKIFKNWYEAYLKTKDKTNRIYLR